MSLRNSLKKAVARCNPLDVQHATFQADTATAHATTVQQTPVIPHGIRAHAATVIATAMQQGAKTSATTVQQKGEKVAATAMPKEKLHVAFPGECNTQHGALTAHRLAKALIAAAMRVCDQHNDSEAAREEMRHECLKLPPHLQQDLLNHFTGKP